MHIKAFARRAGLGYTFVDKQLQAISIVMLLKTFIPRTGLKVKTL